MDQNYNFLEEIYYVMSLLKTHLVVDNETHLKEKVCRDDHEKLSGRIHKPNERSTVENSDIENETHDFHLRGTT